MPWYVRVARLVALAFLFGLGIWEITRAASDCCGGDANAYWDAALRVRAGAELFPAIPGRQDVLETFRYAPWFAWVWVPLTYLPQGAVFVAWTLACFLATILTVVPLLQRPSLLSVALAVFIGGHLSFAAAYGNVQPLMVAPIVWWAEKRSGPVWIALAASLKFTPAAFMLTYVGRGQWRRALFSGFLTAVLLSTFLLYDLSTYPTHLETAWISLPAISWWLWAAVAVAGVALSYRAARTRYAWLTAATTTLVTLPRVHEAYLSWLAVGTRPAQNDSETGA